MAERTKFNPKRRIRPVGAPLPFDLARIRCQGSPLHKSNPGDFGLDPPSAARPGKTLCDEAGIFTRASCLLASLLLMRSIEMASPKRLPAWPTTADRRPQPSPTIQRRPVG